MRAQLTLVAAAVLLFCARGLDVGRVFNHTFDEPTQISSGLELWQYGTFMLHSDVPPLAKLLIAGPTYLAGVRLKKPPQRGDWTDANRILYDSGRYWFVLRSARAVNTAIGALLIVALAWFAWTIFGPWPAVVAAFGVACSPGLVSAGSIANSDILGVLTVVAAFYAFRLLLQVPGVQMAALFALLLAAAVATKLSVVPFFVFGLPVLAAFTLGRRALEPLWHPIAYAHASTAIVLTVALVVPVTIWAAYGFRLAPPIGDKEAARVAESLRPRVPQLAGFIGGLSRTPLPLGDFIRGVGDGYNIARLGPPAYLMGHFSLHGWPYYFLITLLLKVPLGTLCAVLISFLLALQKRQSPTGREVLLLLSLCAAVLLSVAGAGVNAGHRHIVVVEALFALAIAGGISLVLAKKESSRPFGLAVLIFAILAGGVASLRAQPDSLGYTNILAGSEPDWWFIDSNLDWGQDLERLRNELASRNVTEEIHLAYFGTAEPQRHGIRFRPLAPGERASGWIAVSVHSLRGLSTAELGRLPTEEERRGYTWLLAETPVARVGTSIRLYHLPPIAADNFVTRAMRHARPR